jgi:hypothetical protein
MGTRRRIKHHRRRYRGGKPLTAQEIDRRVAEKLNDNPKKTREQAEKEVLDEFVAERSRGPSFDDNENKPPSGLAARQRARAAINARANVTRSPLPPKPAPPPAPKPAPPPKPASSNSSSACSETLEKYGIVGTREEMTRAYRLFAKQNHPDKGGDTATFQKVDGCYRDQLHGGRRRTRRKRHTRHKR